MSQGRCSARVATTFVLVLVWLVVLNSSQVQVADASTTWTVGGSGGWTFNTVAWPNGKRFSVGDTLVFRYNRAFHNVVVVNRAGYSTCSVSRGARVYKSGNDQINLVKGSNYFICSFPGHCSSGMKIAITV